MRLLEDMLSEEDVAAIERVLASNNPKFDVLAAAAGLDPKIDFKFADLRRTNLSGADLRGFDFTGSDLRYCVRDNKTEIDKTTILTGAKVEWIDASALPIVGKMQEVEAATTSEGRRKVLNELTTEFGATNHVVIYLISMAKKARSIEEYLYYFTFLPEDLRETQAKEMKTVGLNLLSKKFSQNKKTKKESFVADNIALQLRTAKGKLARNIFGKMAEIIDQKEETVAMRGIARIEAEDILESFKQYWRKESQNQ